MIQKTILVNKDFFKTDSAKLNQYKSKFLRIKLTSQ